MSDRGRDVSEELSEVRSVLGRAERAPEGEVTAAYVRAVEAAAGSYSTPEGVADAVLDAALDVEEMARAGYEAHPLKDCAWANVPDTIRRWHIAEATAIRAALLGGAA